MEAEKARKAVAKHYGKGDNAFNIQRKRRIKDILAGKKVRIETIVKYGIQEEAKAAGLPYEVKDKSNVVNQVVDSSEGARLRRQVEKKLSQYDNQIAKMVEAKLNQAKAVSKGQARITDSAKITWDDLNTFIDQVPSFTYTTKKGYRGILKNLVTNILKCKPDEDIAKCFNNYQDAIKRVKSAKNPRTGQPYRTLGRFFGLPVSLAKHIPEFEERITKQALRAWKDELYKALEIQEVKMVQKQKDRIVNWDELIRARGFWREEAEETDEIYSWMGYTIMSLYTMYPPLRNDYGCVMIIHSKPRDKKRNYYWPEKGLFYLNHFKTMKRFPDEPPIQFNPTLKGVLQNWIRRSKAKKWLFTTRSKKLPYAGCAENNKAGSFANVVKQVCSRFLQKPGQPPVSINVMRKSKVTSLVGKDEEYRQRIARMMRHSLKTATTAYMRDAFSTDSEQEEVLSEEDF